MNYLTDSQRQVLSKLGEDQKEGIDIIESTINTNRENKENVKDKLTSMIKKQKPENCANFIIQIINLAAAIRPKERESIFYLLDSIIKGYLPGFQISDGLLVLKNMLQVKGVIPSNDTTDKHIIDFADEGTIGKALYDDNIGLLQKLLESNPDEGKDHVYPVNGRFMISFDEDDEEKANRIEVAALFGSIKCFMYLLMNGDEINEKTCKFAVAGGNKELIHLCKQKGLKFEGCLLLSVMYHRFEIFEWLNNHFEYEKIPLTTFIECYNEPLFYFYSLSGSNDDDEEFEYGNTPLNTAAFNGELELVKYLCQTCHADVEAKNDDGDTPLNSASLNNHLGVVKSLHEDFHASVESKDNSGSAPINIAAEGGYVNLVAYLCEHCHVNFETKDEYGCTPLSIAAFNNRPDVIKYLNEQCHADVETKDKCGTTPLINASRSGAFEAVKYLHEKCNANVEAKDNYGSTPLNIASEEGKLSVVKYLVEECKASVEAKNNEGSTPIINASKNGHLEVVQYLFEKCHANVQAKNNDGKTPLSIATEGEHEEVVKYLNEISH